MCEKKWTKETTEALPFWTVYPTWEPSSACVDYCSLVYRCLSSHIPTDLGSVFWSHTYDQALSARSCITLFTAGGGRLGCPRLLCKLEANKSSREWQGLTPGFPNTSISQQCLPLSGPVPLPFCKSLSSLFSLPFIQLPSSFFLSLAYSVYLCGPVSDCQYFCKYVSEAPVNSKNLMYFLSETRWCPLSSSYNSPSIRHRQGTKWWICLAEIRFWLGEMLQEDT